jgi:hypothetical protein
METKKKKWYTTKHWEYVSHTDYEFVLQKIENPQLTAIIYKDEKIPPVIYLGMLFTRSEAHSMELKFEDYKINLIRKSIYNLKK